MYPDLSYFLHDLIGTPVDNWTSIFKTFGIFLVLAILTAAYLLYIELKRKADAGVFSGEPAEIVEGKSITITELLGNALLGFILGFKLIYAWQNFPEFQSDPASILLSTQGNWLGGIVGALLFGGYQYWVVQRKKLPEPIVKKVQLYPHDRIGNITVIAAIFGVIGAKVFDILEHPEDLIADPIGTIVSGSGLAIYGGLIFGFLAVYIYLRMKKIPPKPVLDAVAPALILAYGIGRLGCHFSGDGDWGIVNTSVQPSWWFLPDWLWAYNYPHNVINEGQKIADCVGHYCQQLAAPVYPTSVYEFLMTLLIGGLLWSLRKKITIPGLLFCLYLILNGIERFMIEEIRVNDVYPFLGTEFTQAQFVAMILFLIGIVWGGLEWRTAEVRS